MKLDFLLQVVLVIVENSSGGVAHRDPPVLEVVMDTLVIRQMEKRQKIRPKKKIQNSQTQENVTKHII